MEDVKSPGTPWRVRTVCLMHCWESPPPRGEGLTCSFPVSSAVEAPKCTLPGNAPRKLVL